MRSFLIAFAGLLFFAGNAAQANIQINVDKNAQMMTVSVDGVARYRWPVSTGNPSHETPNGTFRAFRMEADHFSKEFDDAPMPHSIFFTKVGHAIHGTESEGKLGIPVSHGCVRLSKAHAATLYALVEQEGVLNTTVTLTGSATIALAREHRNGAVARNDDMNDAYDNQDNQYAPGQPVELTPQPQLYPARRQAQRPDDGYIYPADGSSNAQIYPAPPSNRRYYNAQAYRQQQQPDPYNTNPGYAQPGYGPQGYSYQQRYYQPRGYYDQD